MGREARPSSRVPGALPQSGLGGQRWILRGGPARQLAGDPPKELLANQILAGRAVSGPERVLEDRPTRLRRIGRLRWGGRSHQTLPRRQQEWAAMQEERRPAMLLCPGRASSTSSRAWGRPRAQPGDRDRNRGWQEWQARPADVGRPAARRRWEARRCRECPEQQSPAAQADRVRPGVRPSEPRAREEKLPPRQACAPRSWPRTLGTAS
jgi:hypothetical protein